MIPNYNDAQFKNKKQHIIVTLISSFAQNIKLNTYLPNNYNTITSNKIYKLL